MGALQSVPVIDPFDDPDITILTNDTEFREALWDMANAAEERGDTSFALSEKLERSLTLDRVHEVWIVVNDGLKSGVLLLGLCGAFKALKPKQGRRTRIRFGGRIQLSRDEENRLRELGIEVVLEKDDAGNDSPKLPIE